MEGKKLRNPKLRAKKGEPGYHERNTGPAVAATTAALSIFPTVEEFDEAVAKYFDECDASETLYGEAGLCLALSKYNAKGKVVTLSTLRKWYDGESCSWLQDSVQMAYLRIQQQIETDPRYREKGGMATRAIFLQKQSRFGGYQDKQEVKNDSTVKIIFGEGMNESDFK